MAVTVLRSIPSSNTTYKKNMKGSSTGDSAGQRAVQPYPYFQYRDFSSLPDPDPLIPLTSPGRVPNFPAKMHSILSRSDLSDVVAWMPHGRAWRVLKPKEFESQVIPTYFEHAKFSSFVRQANGWGFRRITRGPDRNCYYHELFLRGLPHLSKLMKRPGVAQKLAADPEHEPDLLKISIEHPVPEKSEDDRILLQCTLEGGPKARMPICVVGTTPHVRSPPSSSFAPMHAQDSQIQTSASAQGVSSMLGTVFQPVVQSQENEAGSSPYNLPLRGIVGPPQLQVQAMHTSSQHRLNAQSTTFAPCPSQSKAPNVMPNLTFTPPLTAVEQYHSPPPMAPHAFPQQTSVTITDPTAVAQFAAGFAAAAALTNENFRDILGQALINLPRHDENSNIHRNSNLLPAGLLQALPQGSIPELAHGQTSSRGSAAVSAPHPQPQSI